MHPILQELGAILKKWNLVDVLGICSLGGKSIDRPATMEFTSGRANITLPFDIAPQDGSAIDAMWQFGSKESASDISAGSLGNCDQTPNEVCSSP